MSTSVGAPGAPFGRKQAIPTQRWSCPGKRPRDGGWSPGAGVAAQGRSLAGASTYAGEKAQPLHGPGECGMRGGDGAGMSPGSPSAWCCHIATGWLNEPGLQGGPNMEPFERVDAVLWTLRGACQAFWVSRRCDGCGGRVHRPRWGLLRAAITAVQVIITARGGAVGGDEQARGARGLRRLRVGMLPGLGLWVSPLGQPLPQWALQR